MRFTSFTEANIWALFHTIDSDLGTHSTASLIAPRVHFYWKRSHASAKSIVIRPTVFWCDVTLKWAWLQTAVLNRDTFLITIGLRCTFGRHYFRKLANGIARLMLWRLNLNRCIDRDSQFATVLQCCTSELFVVNFTFWSAFFSKILNLNLYC